MSGLFIYESFKENLQTIERLDKEIPKYKDKINSLHLCLATDPFMYGYEDVAATSIKIIKKWSKLSLNEEYRERIEPGAVPYKERLEALRVLHERVCKTWASMEPYPTPN